MHSSRMTLALLMFALLLPGCGAPYVRVPPMEGDFALNDPNDGHIVKVEAASLRHVLLKYHQSAPYAIDLPAGTSSENYEWVLSNLPPGGVRVGKAPTDTPMYRVAQVFVKGNLAQADVIIPRPEGPRLVTIKCVPDLQGWYAAQSKLWNLPVEQALPQARPPIPRADELLEEEQAKEGEAGEGEAQP